MRNVKMVFGINLLVWRCVAYLLFFIRIDCAEEDVFYYTSEVLLCETRSDSKSFKFHNPYMIHLKNKCVAQNMFLCKIST